LPRVKQAMSSQLLLDKSRTSNLDIPIPWAKCTIYYCYKLHCFKYNSYRQQFWIALFSLAFELAPYPSRLFLLKSSFVSLQFLFINAKVISLSPVILIRHLSSIKIFRLQPSLFKAQHRLETPRQPIGLRLKLSSNKLLLFKAWANNYILVISFLLRSKDTRLKLWITP